jgi:GntR family transcriptional repressor for pyruvate dehydrogenase complex
VSRYSLASRLDRNLDYAVGVEMFVPVGPKRAFEGAVSQIAEQIRLGVLGEGDRLPAERDLAAAMQISRATLREAVRVLVAAGVLAVKPGSAGCISVISNYVPQDIVREESELRLGEVVGVLEARRLFEPRVAQLASMRAREDDFARMQATIDAQRALVAQGDLLENMDRFLQFGAQFHVRIADATGSSTVVSQMRFLLRQIEAARSMTIREGPFVPDFTIEIHDRTLAAIRSADQARIDAVMDEHLAAMEHAWERQTGRPLVRPVPDFLRPIAERAHAEEAKVSGT